MEIGISLEMMQIALIVEKTVNGSNNLIYQWLFVPNFDMHCNAKDIVQIYGIPDKTTNVKMIQDGNGMIDMNMMMTVHT